MARRDRTVLPADDAFGLRPLNVVRRRYHLHAPGIVYVLTTFLMSVGAINSQNNLLFWAFGVAVTALVVSGVLSGAALMGVEVSRDVPPAGQAGEPVGMRYHIRNRNRLIPLFGLTLMEVDAPVRGGAKPTWPGLMEAPRAFASEIGAGQRAVAECAGVSLRRGLATFENLRVSTTFPFGLTRKSTVLAGHAELIVRPRVHRLRPGLLATRARRGDRHGVSSNVARHGEEFFSLREYQPGDNTRAVAWRATAKAGEWLVRSQTLPGPQRIWIIIDAAEKDGEPAETAISLAASLAVYASESGLIVGLQFAAAGLVIPPQHSVSALATLLDRLAMADWKNAAHAGPAPIGANDAVAVVHAGSEATGPADALHFFAPRLAEYVDAGAAAISPPAETAA